MKPIQITAEQYLQDQLDKHLMTDPLSDILKQIENQTHISKTHANNDQLNNIHTGNSMHNTQQESTSNNDRNNVNQTNGRMNSEQKDSVNNIPPHKNNEEHTLKSDTYTRTRYGRTVQKPDRLTY